MILGLGQGLHFYTNWLTGGAYLLGPVIDVLGPAGYTYDTTCLSSSLDTIYYNDASSPYGLFRHTYDTLEIAGNVVDRYCLQADMVAISSEMYDAFYREEIAVVRALALSDGFDIIEKEYDTTKVELARFNPDQALYQVVNTLDDGGTWYNFTVMESLIAAQNFDTINRTALFNTFLSYES